jgi:hypothetical protein
MTLGQTLTELSENFNTDIGEHIMETTLASTAGFFGTVWFTALVFIAGAFIGAPMWNWVKAKFPWNQ